MTIVELVILRSAQRVSKDALRGNLVYRTDPQKRWMREQASSSTALEVA